jgi:hypothetical protein
MAERRMFTQKIVGSDPFTEMPLSAQALYFHLNMEADDDGFVNNPNKIRRSIGAAEDDLKLLIAKRFILAFDNGTVVVKHWRMHNSLRKDRYKPTQYQTQMASLQQKANGTYTEKKPLYPDEIDDSNHLTTTWQPLGNQVAPQDSVGKDSIDKDSIGECESRSEQSTPTHATTPTLDDVIQYCKSKNYPFAEKFYTYYQSVNWLDKNGKQIDWKSKADYWKLCDDEKKSNKPRYGNFDVDDAINAALQRTESEMKRINNPPKTAGEDEEIRKRAEALKNSFSK